MGGMKEPSRFVTVGLGEMNRVLVEVNQDSCYVIAVTAVTVKDDAADL